MQAATTRRRQLGGQRVPAIRNNGTIVTGLEEDATYLVQVWANTAAGAGKRSPLITVSPPPTLLISTLTAIIVGSLVGLAAMVSVVVMVVVVVRGYRKRKKPIRK